jgi:DNA-binding transcriptional ArsR family regulator
MKSRNRDSAAVFAALADPTRRELLDQLAQHGPLNASAIAGDYELSRQAIAKHLGVLHEAGLVSSERHGNEVRFAVVPGAFDDVTHWLAGVGRQWDRRLVTLRKQVHERGE